MHVNFVRLDHAEFHSRFFFDHFQAFFQIPNFGRQSIVGEQRLLVLLILCIELFRHVGNIRHAATAKPQLRVNNHEQCDQSGRDKAMAHGSDQRRL